jgi:hypothetical protein
MRIMLLAQTFFSSVATILASHFFPSALLAF